MEVVFGTRVKTNMLSDIDTVKYDDEKGVVMKRENQKIKRIGNICMITGAEYVVVCDYYGSEISKIDATDDVLDMTQEKLALRCSSVQAISDRVILTFDDGRNVDIHGWVESASSK